MGRKNLFAALTGVELPAGNSPGEAGEAAQAPAPYLGVMGTRGAIGAVTRSIEQLKAQSVVDIEPDLIEASFVADRLDSSQEHHQALVESIRTHGQQVPVLVRPHAEKPGHFQIAYGRRRVLAIRELGLKVRAIIKTLTDEQLVVAQGQENSARQDLTFIEKALFAARLEQRGYGRETIMAALTIDKTGLSRLISAAVKIPHDLIELIGAAPAIGRDRWVALSARLEAPSALTRARQVAGEDGFASLPSDERFNRLFAAAAPKAAKPPRPVVLKGADGAKFGHVKDEARALVVSIDKKVAEGFAQYLRGALPELYANYRRGVAQERDPHEPGKEV